VLERLRAVSLTDPAVWFWTTLLVIGGVLPTFYVDDYVYSVLVLFGLYATINLMWSLVIGTAGILSFATLAIVGVGAYLATYMSLHYGWNWPEMFAVALGAGLLLGAVVAAPAIRLRGVYFALLTFGLVELFRSYVSLSDYLGLAYGLFGARSFVPERFDGTHTGSIIAYYAAMGLLVGALVVYWTIQHGRVGLLLRTARESEPVAKALGVDVIRARFAVFVASSAMLGLTGAFYASYYKGVSPSIFDFGKVLLLFAMMVVGGMWSARGVLIGTGLLLFIDQHWLSAGPPRFIAIGALMLAVTLFTERGLDGIPAQIRNWFGIRRGRRRASDAGPDPRDEAGGPNASPQVRKESLT
jgi:branched-chain amino acid transport system permease protein